MYRSRYNRHQIQGKLCTMSDVMQTGGIIIISLVSQIRH